MIRALVAAIKSIPSENARMNPLKAPANISTLMGLPKNENINAAEMINPIIKQFLFVPMKELSI